MNDEFALVTTLVTNENGNNFINEEGHILVQRLADGERFFIPDNVIENEDMSFENTAEDSQLTDDQGCRVTWTRDDILQLIAQYKLHKSAFASTTIKNIKVWQRIATNLHNSHTAKQCENKFKYLKNKYLQKKDNMSNKRSGARAINFQFFEEMDEIFATQPIVQPIAIASSSRSNEIDDTPPITVEDQSPAVNASNATTNNTQASNSNKKKGLQYAIENLNNTITKSEIEKERRHQELLALQQSSMKTMSEIMVKILEKM